MSLPRVQRATVRVLFAYDIGLSIQLEQCSRHVEGLTADERIKHKGHAPDYFQFDPSPLHVVQDSGPVRVGVWSSARQVEITLFDFGGVSVAYTLDFSGSFEELIELSSLLATTDAFRVDSRLCVENILALLREAVLKPNVADLEEDYLVFQIDRFESEVPLDDLHTVHRAEVARLLRSERDPLSEQEISDALGGLVSFGIRDVALVDWSAALLVDDEPDDVLAVLEFANLQLLEMRFLDAKLDQALDRAYEASNAPRHWLNLRLSGPTRKELRLVAQRKVESAIMFERVTNAIKMLGDQYLARVYRQVSNRYRMSEWNTGILRKLDTIEGIYQKVHDDSSGTRMEVLEGIVIFLIAFEIVLVIFGGH
ncbi:MAG: hypothetical protein SGI72_08850 [Planctomycetota bacterium]|nr:hypothetical protein [Planctomycetota bacterium]